MAVTDSSKLKLNEPRLVEPSVPEQLVPVTDLDPLLAESDEGLTLVHVLLKGVNMSDSGRDSGVRAFGDSRVSALCHMRVAHVTKCTDPTVTKCPDPTVTLMMTELSESRVEGCVFAGCDFSKSWFVDAIFQNCDFSNCVFEDANFTRCSFQSCKFTGADITNGIFAQCAMDDCLLNLATLANARFKDCLITRTDLTGADLSGAKQVRLAFGECKFEETSFFRMSLAGIDFSSSKLGALTISDGMEELSGCCMDLLQAAGIAKRLGVIIKEEDG